MSLPQVDIKFNVPQALFAMVQRKETYLEWGRGTGKSTVIAWRIKDIVKHMPRSKNGIVGSTYQQLLTRTLPSTIEGLELLGFKKDVHYFVGKRPPPEWKWEEAYQPPLTFDNYITFYNGTGFQLISLDNPNSGRGLNLDSVIGDEAALMDFEKLSYNVLLSNRGNIHRFKHTYLHHSLLFASTTPVTVRGKWFTQQEEKANQDPNKISYIIAPSTYNFENLGVDFFRINKRLSTQLMYNAEIMCIRPTRSATGFYPAFDEIIHTYLASNDNYVFGSEYDLNILKGKVPDADVLNAPIDVACDYGAKINTLVCGQLVSERFNVLNAMFVKTPKTIADLAAEFCQYYSFHKCKEINYIVDHTAIPRNANGSSYADEFQKVMEQNGWSVNRIYVGQAPHHAVKYVFMDQLLKEETQSLPRVRFNAENCKYLIISIQQAAVKEGRNGVEKDKTPERNQHAIDEETTHFSDAFDTLVYFKFKDGLAQRGSFVFGVY